MCKPCTLCCKVLHSKILISLIVFQVVARHTAGLFMFVPKTMVKKKW